MQTTAQVCLRARARVHVYVNACGIHSALCVQGECVRVLLLTCTGTCPTDTGSEWAAAHNSGKVKAIHEDFETSACHLLDTVNQLQ